MIALELNSCAGGMALGARAAGIEFAVAIDWDADACESYEGGLGKRPLQIDIRELVNLARRGWRPAGSVDLLVADPPCTPWSRSGKREGLADERDLILETVELIGLLRPRAWLIGNVPGLDDGPNVTTVQKTIGQLADRYRIDYARLDAADYGVPQHRVRPFWFGRPLDSEPLRWPQPTHGDPSREALPGLGVELIPWVTVRQALGHLPPDDLGKPIRLRKRSDGGHPSGRADEPAMVVPSSQPGNGGATIELLEPRSNCHPISHADEPAKVIATSAHRGAQGGAVVDGYEERRRANHKPSDPDAPARTLTRNTHSDGALLENDKHPINTPDEPSFTVTAKGDGRGAQGACVVEWPWDRPATTVQADERIAPPGHHEKSFLSAPDAFAERPSTTVTARDEVGAPGRNGRDGSSQSTSAIKLSERAALILQGFPDGYVIAGKTKRARWSQIGQAMPPGLAAPVFRSIRRWFEAHEWMPMPADHPESRPAAAQQGGGTGG